jgi:hypothetical protein
MRRSLLLCCVFLVQVARAQVSGARAEDSRAQVTFYVSTQGKDNGASGSLARPFRTLGRAVDRAEAIARSDGEKGKSVHILLRGGTYYLERTLVLTGEGPSALEISGFRSEIVNVSAGRRLQLAWTPYKDGIYQASVPAGIVFERLYVNGKLQVLARYPNYNPGARIFHGTAADAISPERVRRWKEPEGGYVHALHGYEWGGFHYLITGVDDSGRLKLEGGWQNNRPGPMHKQYRFVENIFEELDTAGEWWLDRARGVLYYKPPIGVSLAGARVEVSHLKNSIELRGTAGRPVRHVRLRGIHFLHNERTFMDTKEPLVRSDWTIYRGGAVVLEGTEDCQITNCTFSGLGGNAIMVSNYNRRDTISGCLIEHMGANAVCFVGDPKAVRSPSFRYEESIPAERLDTTPGPLTDNYPARCVVSDNLMHDLGEIEKQATGVEIEISEGIVVRHNSIYNTPRAGLNIGDGCFGGHLLEYNDVFNTVLETGDHGSFNSWGRDRYWSPNRPYMDSLAAVHPGWVLLDAGNTTIIRNNRFRCDHGWDIDLDDGSSNYHIYDNVCLNGGLKLREGFYRVVENNILINSSFHPHVWFAHSGDVFRHNIVMKDYAPIGIQSWGLTVDDNLFPDTAALGKARARGTDEHSSAGEAMFDDAVNGDYRVQSGSPALAVGFRNFSMDSFGVMRAVLRKMAARPIFPELISSGGRGSGGGGAVGFLGGTIKSVEGVGERSAYGLPDETGVIVVSAGSSGMQGAAGAGVPGAAGGSGALARSGLKDGDVIRMADGKSVRTVGDLKKAYETGKGRGRMDLQVIRGQQVMSIGLVF